ncbi:MAG: pilus assembly protein N-terminal domain-containing protein [Bacteriovoracaceae bacterium]|nr:pilus assembly protein N-terminal domain-containing protein [Bacteriovoracaceae bacterium]
MKLNLFSNYFVSLFSWMANFGVVPLFLFSCFLFLPIFFNLFALLVFVTFVLETIMQLPSLSSTKVFIETRFVPKHAQSVKALFLLAWIPCLNAHLPPPQVHNRHNLIIARGEHREISVKNLLKYTIGNPQIIGHKLLKAKQVILLKGKKIGFSELVVWKKGAPKEVYRIYVLAKNKHLKVLHLADVFKTIGLKVVLAGPLIVVNGKLDDFNNYRLLKKVYLQNKEYLHLKGSLDDSLRNQIIGNIYHHLFNEYIDNIRCEAKAFNIICQYPKTNPPSNETKEFIENYYFATLVAIDDQELTSNYLVKLKILQLEQLDGEELSLGIDQLDASLNDFFEQNLQAITENNVILLRHKKVDLSSLADPEAIIQINRDAILQIGAQTPFKTQHTQNGNKVVTTIWKFAGLKIKLKLTAKGKKLSISYSIEFSRIGDQGGSIIGSKESGALTIEPNRPIQMFQIGLKTNGELTTGMPYLENIPILGSLFKSKSNQTNYKKITGIIKLVKHEL